MRECARGATHLAMVAPRGRFVRFNALLGSTLSLLPELEGKHRLGPGGTASNAYGASPWIPPWSTKGDFVCATRNVKMKTAMVVCFCFDYPTPWPHPGIDINPRQWILGP